MVLVVFAAGQRGMLIELFAQPGLGHVEVDEFVRAEFGVGHFLGGA